MVYKLIVSGWTYHFTWYVVCFSYICVILHCMLLNGL